MTDIAIHQATTADARAVALFCQPVYACVYPNAKYGLKPEHFSPEIFTTADTIEYFAGILAPSARQQAFLAMKGEDIVGCISIARLDEHYEIRGFYIRLDQQKQGIGSRLLRRALQFAADDLPVRVEVAETIAALNVYQKWGFKPAPELGIKYRHWPEWPDGLHNAYVFLQAPRKDIHA